MSRLRVGVDPDLVNELGYRGAELAAWELPDLQQGQVLDAVDIAIAANCTAADFYPATVEAIEPIICGRRIAWLSR